MKALLHFSLTACLFCILSPIYAQNENKVWYFGNHAGLDFNSGTPVPLLLGQLNTAEGCSSIADNTGALLFYTDGQKVWNRSHALMPNGTGLLGDPSTTQSALIIPKPGSTTMYYIFAIDDLGGAMTYSIVDMSLAGGMGDVTATKNVALHPAVSEKQAAVIRCDGSIWLLSHQWGTNTFYADLITSSGIMPSVLSATGTVHTGGSGTNFNSVGQMKISQQGNRIALTMRDANLFELFNFDINTGVVSNPITLSSTSFSTGYGIEFSPDGSKLYGGTLLGGNVYQFNLLAGTPAAILASGIQVGSSSGLTNSLQLGTDGKIYVAKSVNQTVGIANLDVINNPNAAGAACNYVVGGRPLGGKLSLLGLPNLLVHMISITDISVTPDMAICGGASTTLTATGATAYTWTGGVNATTSSVTVSPSVSTTYYVTGSNTCGSDTDTVTVSVDAPPAINATGTTHICRGQSATLSASGSSSYTWSGGVSSTSSTVTVSPAATTTYYVTSAANACGSDIDTVVVAVDSMINISVSAPTTICRGGTATLSASGSPTYTWSGGVSSTSPSVLVSPGTATNYYVTGASNLCGSDTDTITVSVDTLVYVSVSGITTICNGQSTTLTASGSSSYTWYGGISSSSSAVSVSPSVTTSYYISGVANVCGSDTDTVVVTVNDIIPVNATGSATICAGSSTVLSATGSPSYTWSGGVSSTSSSVTVSPMLTTNYYVTGLSNGCGSDTDTLTVTVDSLINISVTGNDTLCNGQTAVLSAHGSPSYTWTGGINAVTDSVTITPAITTTYYVTGSTNACGADTDTIVVAVIGAPADINVMGTDSICTGQTTVLSASGSSSYTWTGGISTSADSVTVSPLINTTYYVTGAANTCGFSDTDTITVHVSSIPDINITGTNAICAGQNTTLTASGASSYTWSGAVSASTNAVTVSPLTTSVYYVTATNGCGSDTDTIEVSVSEIVTINVSGTDSICRGQTTTLSAFGSPSYTWTGGISAATASVSVTPLTTTTYFVSGVANMCGADTDTLTVFVDTLPVIQVTGVTAICSGQSTSLIANGGSSYVWSGAASATGNTLTVTPAATSTYYITAYSTLCGSDSDTLTVTVNNYDPAQYSYTFDECTHQVVFENLATNASAYYWNFGNGTSSTLENPVNTFAQGIYNVTLVTNPNTMCADSVQHTITVAGTTLQSLLIPNVFTPNGDGINDEFKISGLLDCREYTLEIYNRWGQKVFETNTPGSVFWTGCNGEKKDIVEGTYFYILTSVEGIAQSASISGTVSVIR